MKTLPNWTDTWMRDTREKWRDFFNAWVGNDAEAMIGKAEELRKDLGDLVECLKRKDVS